MKKLFYLLISICLFLSSCSSNEPVQSYDFEGEYDVSIMTTGLYALGTTQPYNEWDIDTTYVPILMDLKIYRDSNILYVENYFHSQYKRVEVEKSTANQLYFTPINDSDWVSLNVGDNIATLKRTYKLGILKKNDNLITWDIEYDNIYVPQTSVSSCEECECTQYVHIEGVKK